MAKKFTERKIGDIVVSNDVPFPVPANQWHGKWPFTSMKVGESFPIASENEMLRARAAASYSGSRAAPPMKFSIRKTHGTEEAPYRCWRIE